MKEAAQNLVGARISLKALSLPILLILATIPWLCITRIALSYLLYGEIFLWFFTYVFLRAKSDYLLIYFFFTIAFFVSGEIYFRLHYFGPEGLSMKTFQPRYYHYMDGKSSNDPTTYTGLRASDQAFYLGKQVRINKDGFRGRDYPLTKDPGVFRIVYLGVSVGWGSGVTEDERFTDLLEKKLNTVPSLTKRIELINLSIVGAKFGHVLHVLKDVGLKYDPDLILFEAGRMMLRKTSKLEIFQYREPPPRKLARDIAFVDEGLARHFYFASYLFSLSNNFFPAFEFPEDQNVILSKFVERAKALAGSKTLVFFDLPEMAPSQQTKEFDQIFITDAARLNIPVIKGEEISFPGPVEDWIIYPGDLHPNAKANVLYADKLFTALEGIMPRKNSVIPSIEIRTPAGHP